MSDNYSQILDSLTTLPTQSLQQLAQGEDPGEIAKGIAGEILTTVGGEQFVRKGGQAALGFLKNSEFGQNMLSKLQEAGSSLKDSIQSGIKSIGQRGPPREQEMTSQEQMMESDPEQVLGENIQETNIDTVEAETSFPGGEGESAPEEAANTEGAEIGEEATEGAEIGAEVGEEAGITTANAIADTTAAATAEIPGLDIITGLVALGTGLATLFVGNKHHHDDTTPPLPVKPNVADQPGIN